MHKIKSQTAPSIFQSKFRKPTVKYPTNLPTPDCNIQLFKLSKPRYRISFRDATLGKNIATDSSRMQENVIVFKNPMRKNLLELENEITYF